MPLLAKLANFIPEAGIWMNTQRPEWNDANNALVGYGVSMVTLCYLRRYLEFCRRLFQESGQRTIVVSAELADQLSEMQTALQAHRGQLSTGFDDRQRRDVLDGLGAAGSHYRKRLYHEGLSGATKELTVDQLDEFLELAVEFLDQSIEANRRQDGLYHAYNLMEVQGDGAISIRHLYEMLEGQVAAISSGKLLAEECLSVLRALRASRLYRPNQHSYVLYPDRQLPRFLEKNRVPDSLANNGAAGVLSQDWQGRLRFKSQFRNAAVLSAAIEQSGCAEDERAQLLAAYEQVFDHRSFTGRSGTFFKYEGLGCIYWHMVSKLLLAVQEVTIRADEAGEDPALVQQLVEHYRDIQAGIGASKSVLEQGAFPTDPYSHTPSMLGAQQPGLTGQVKEDFLARLTELGVRVHDGCLRFDPLLLPEQEFRDGKLTFTFCTVPVEMRHGDVRRMRVIRADGKADTIDGLTLDQQLSQEIFDRRGTIERLEVTVP